MPVGKKGLLTALCLILMIPQAGAYAQETQVEWTYPVSMSALSQAEYVRLVNKDNLLPSDYVPEDLVKIKAKKTSSSAIYMRQVASDALDAMFAAALNDGVTLYAHSGYRSYQTQKTMYSNRLKDNNGKDDGVVAYPGASDHQTGLGIDVISKEWIGKKFNEGFSQTPEAQWMDAHCAEYGFIVRYPMDKGDITGIIFEPWHLRYVGQEVARYIMDHHLVLEEFTAEWQKAKTDFEAAGGSVQGSLAQEQVPDQPQVLDETGADGDPEISMFH